MQPPHAPTADTAARHNLGRDLTRFVGRARLLDEVGARFVAGARLVTLTGAAGIGKTRLAREWTRSQLAGAAGWVECWFCDLSAATPAGDVAAAVLAVVDPDREVLTAGNGGSAAGQLHALLRQRGPILLVLDNLEQVVAGAARAVEAMLAACPEVRILTTSRARLRLRAEHTLEVEPLDAAAALDLFQDRVRAAGGSAPDPTGAAQSTVAAIVSGLDGIPLALELAAARFAVLGLSGLQARLGAQLGLLRAPHRDVPDRHRTLDAAVAWSWALLDKWERATLVQLSVFAGGFDLAAAEAVVDLQGYAGAPHVIEAVATLCDHSLVHVQHPTRAAAGRGPESAAGSGERPRQRSFPAGRGGRRSATDTAGPTAGLELRYYLLAPIAAFVVHRRDEGEVAFDVVRLRHAEYYARLGDALRTRATFDHDPLAAGELTQERPNITAAHLNVRGEHPALGARLALAAQALWVELDPDSGAPELLASAVECALRSGDAQLCARALRLRGSCRCRRGDLELGRQDLERARELAVAAGDKLTVLLHVLDVGRCAIMSGHAAAARADLEAAAAEAEAVGGTPLLRQASLVAGAAAADVAAFDAARRHFATALRVVARSGRDHEVAAHASLAWLELEAGRAELAWSHSTQAVAIAARLPGHRASLSALIGRGSLHLLLGRADEALADLASASRAAVDGDLWEIHGSAELWRAAAWLAVADIAAADASLASALDHVPSGDRRGRAALALVADAAASAREGSPPPRPERAASSQLARLVGRALDHGAGPIGRREAPSEVLQIASDGSWFHGPVGQSIDLRGRRRVAKLLALLAERRVSAPGRGVSTLELYAAGWPGGDLSDGSRTNRVYVAVSRLRRLGLAHLLIKGHDGYFLNPRVPLTVVQTNSDEPESAG